jgi:hypothetical protein
MKRAWIALGGGLAALVVLWAWLVPGAEPALPPSASNRHADEALDAGTRPPTEELEALTADAGTAELERRAAEPLPRTTDAQPGSDERMLHGTFVVRDERGVEHAHESGGFVLRPLVTDVVADGAVSPLRTQGQVITVANGRWQAKLDRRTTQAFVSHVELGGRAALVGKDAEIVAIPAAGALELRADWHARTLLRVTGWDTGSDLSDVDVICFTQANRSSMIPTGIDDPGSRGAPRVVSRAARSPITITPDLDLLPFARGYFWARAPGYGWDRIELDLGQGGGRRAHLDARPRSRHRRARRRRGRPELAADAACARVRSR